jgi:hypothetical protein
MRGTMDIYRNPDEVIREVERDEGRREDTQDIEHERDESPEEPNENPEEDDGAGGGARE